MQRQTPRLILASQSASRRAMLAQAGLRFDALAAHLDEAAIRATGPAIAAEDMAMVLAQAKAKHIGGQNPDALVIGADQILVCEDAWFDKPETMEEAARHLRRLRGRTHRLATAVVCHQGGVCVWRHVASPELTMRAFSDAFLTTYLRTEGRALLGSVGAYRLEGLGAQLFSRIEGDFFTILGLPLLALLAYLRDHGALID